MREELAILKYLKNHGLDLLPVEGINIRFEAPGSKNKEWQPDFVAQVSYHGKRLTLIGEIVTNQSSSVFRTKISLLKSYAGKGKDLVPIVVARYISPERRKQCQEMGIFFLDFSGNVFLAYDGLHIERVGFPNRFPEKRRGRSPFSDKASLILRAAFSDIRKAWGVRELAQSVGLDPGFVSRMVKELEQRNYVLRVDSKVKLREAKGILEDWGGEYDHKRNQEERFFFPAKGPEEILDKLIAIRIPDEVPYALGLHAGANLVAPYAVYNEVHIYIQNTNQINWFAEKMKLRKVDKGANLIFLAPYYKNSVFYGKQAIRDLWVVSDLQLYLDLHNYPVRGLEQAEHLYEKRLKRLIEK